ncbi:hypothetical protein D1872_152790 [compost metagenome]
MAAKNGFWEGVGVYLTSVDPKSAAIFIGLAFAVPVTVALISRFALEVLLSWKRY